MTDKETDDINATLDEMVDIEVEDDAKPEVEAEDDEVDQGDDDDGGDEAEPDEPEESNEPTEEEKAEAEEKKKWPKLTSKERRDRKRRAEEHTKRELETTRNETLRMRQENAEIKRQLSMLQAQTVDSKLVQIDQYYQQAQAAYVEAVNNGDRDTALKADQFIQNLIVDRARHLHEKQVHIEQSKPKPVQQPPQVSPVVASYAEKFQRDNPWFETDANGNPKNDESAIALAIDKLVVSEGYSPDTPEYWQVLRSRVNRAVRKETTAPVAKGKTGGPVLGSGKPGGKKTVAVEQQWIDAFGGGEVGQRKAAEYLRTLQK